MWLVSYSFFLYLNTKTFGGKVHGTNAITQNLHDKAASYSGSAKSIPT
jgi:hypothetical protein